LLMFAQWAVFLITRQVPELKTERVRVLFHIVYEFLTAAILIVSGVGVLMQPTWAAAIYPVALGLFAALLIFTAISLIVFWQVA